MLTFNSFPGCCTTQVASGILSSPTAPWKHRVAGQFEDYQDFAIITLITTKTQEGAADFLESLGFERVFVGKKSHNTYKQRHQETGDLTLWAGEPAVLREKSREWIKNNPIDMHEEYKKARLPVNHLVTKLSKKSVLEVAKSIYKADYTDRYENLSKPSIMAFIGSYITVSSCITHFGLDIGYMCSNGMASLTDKEVITFQENLVKDGHIKGFKDE